MIFIASLLVVSEALDATGVTAWAGQKLVSSAGDSRTRLIVLMMTLVALLTALINVNGAVAALVPVVVTMAVRLGRPPSQLGERLLPSRTARTVGPDFSGHAHTLVRQYALEERPDTLVTRRSGVAEVIIPPRSDLVGAAVFPGMLTDSGDLVILAVQRAGETLGPGETQLAEGDVLLLRGTWPALDQQLEDGGVLVVHPPGLVRRQAVPLGPGAKRAIAVLGAMMVLLVVDISAKPVLMSVAVSAAAAFLTPIATPANMMVMGPGGYRSGDYWKLGLPLLALFGAVAVLLVPVVWSF